ncbi:uncharacterized protein LOC128205007 [Mya arenaria]|uniref:uncharacterized protein LOC128205007 n=1 Tax=Mya arenaria TaxID=6604 RepID=UPI0022DF5C9B|nr:uncharacterized protein LOC128205007 [Mya arenaria]
MAQYNEHFTTPESQNWLKGWVAVKTAAEALAPFACNVCDDIRVKKLKKSIKHLVPDLCENCSIVEIIPCDPNNNICNAGQCRFHNGRIFRPCLIVKCNEYRNTVTDDIQKGIDIRFTCNSCRTTEIVKCNPRNKVCNSGRCKFHMDQNTKQFIPTRPCRNNICDTLRDAIEQKHRFGNPSWKNTDARKWCVNAWDIAKCFMPPDGYADVENEEDTDLNGIISVYINCEEFQQYFTADLSLPRNLCTKVRDVGKHVRHAPKPEVTDDNLKVWFTDLKALLSDPTFHKANPRAQDAIDQLDKLESDDYVIPPSDIKAALEGLERKAIDLVDVLQRKTDDGVLAIQEAENIATQNIKSLNEYDQPLFKSDLKKGLIVYHGTNNCSLPLGPCLDLEDSGLEDLYLWPNISRVILQSIHKDKTSIEQTTEPLSNLEQLFSSKGIIFLTADAGVGKTSFCKFLVLSWCKVQEGTTDLKSTVSGTQNVSSIIEYLKEFTYLFYVNLRENQCAKLEDIIFSHTESVDTKLTRDNKAFDNILSKENGLFILDGLDECKIPLIMSMPVNRKYTVLITSRPWKLANISMQKKYTHAQIEVMKQDLSKQLVNLANECLNKHFKTSYDTDDFLDAVKTQCLESQLENPMFALQLLCIYHDKRSENKTCSDNATVHRLCSDSGTTSVPRQTGLTYLGKTRSHVYANMIELMLRSTEKKEESLVQDLSEYYKNNGQPHALPECFDERNYACCGLAKLIYAIGKLAAYSLLGDNKSLIEEHQIRKLKKDETSVLLKSGLLSKTSLKTISGESNVYTFLHQTYKEMLACVFLSSHGFDSDIWRKFIENFGSVVSPDMLSFLCVMNYEQGCKCVDMFNESKRLFVRDGTFYTSELIAYQTTIAMTHKECFDNGIKEPRITLKHALLNPDSGIGTDHALLQGSGLELETLFISNYSFTTAIEPNFFSNSLVHLLVEDVKFRDDHIVLSKCTHLSSITIQNTRLSHVTINPSSLEMFWVYVRPEMIQEIPPMKLSFVGGSQFSSNLKELSLAHVTMDVPLDLANCPQLQELVMKNTSSDSLTGVCVVRSMQRCDALQELRLDTLTFPADTHLDLSGLTHLSNITIHHTRLSHVTINPSCLENFWVNEKPELIQEIPPVKLSFVGGSQFSSNLKKLSLAHVTMDVPLDLANCPQLQKLVMKNTSSDSVTGICVVRNMQRCDALQELRLDTLTFPADTHLDLSELTCLTDISLVRLTTDITVQFPQNVHVICIDGVTFCKNTHLVLSGLTHLSNITILDTRLSRVTINPSCLENFWVYVKPELIQEIPPVKLSFVGGSQFSSNLKELCLVHVTMDVPLDLANCPQYQKLVMKNTSSDSLTGVCVVRSMQRCDALQKLRLDTLTFPVDTHLDLSGLTHLSKITIQNTRLSRVTINPSCLEEFWVAVKPELIQEIPPVKLSFVGGSQFSSNLKELSLVHVIMDVPLDLANCQQLHKLVMTNTSSDSVTAICVVRSMQRCDALQELYLDTLTFPADTHLDLSGLTHLSSITIQNTRLSRVTINPSCLENFWVYVKPELIQEIPPVKLSFVGGSQFSSNLKELCLVHVTMDVPLDLANCQQLHNLGLGNTSSDTMTDTGVVCNMQRCDALQELRVDALTFPVDTHLDLSGLTHLSSITIQNTRLSRVTINPSCLEMFWVAVKPELIQEIPPVKLSFVGGSQFTSNLKELSLVHVTMDVPLDLANCPQLQQLVMENTSSDSVTGICVVRNMQRCDALQKLRLDTLTFPADTHLDLSELTCLTDIYLELRLDTLTFPADTHLDLSELTCLTDIYLFPQNVHEIFIYGVTFCKNTHLVLSGLTHLSNITILDTRLSRVTINPSCLEKFWVYVKPELIQEIPPVKLSFVGGSQFSSNLKELSLVHVTMDVPLDLANCPQYQKLVMKNTSSDSLTGICVVRSMQRCDALQELRLDTLTFPADTHLDLSGLTHLSKITIQHTRLSHVTINPSCLEKFWVYVKPELIQEIPPMKLSFDGGSKFSSKLTMLSLVHTSNNHSVDLSECVQLQTLRTCDILQIGTLGLPHLEEARLFGAQTDFGNNVLQLISESSCPCRRIWFENLSPEIFSSLTVSRTYAQKFESFKFRFMLFDINVFDFIKTVAVKKVEFEEVKIVKAQQLVALLTCTEPIQASDNTADGTVELPVGLRVSDISFSECPVLGSTVEELDSAIECLRRVWEIKEVKIETQQSSISNTVCGEDIISENHIVLMSLQLKSN